MKFVWHYTFLLLTIISCSPEQKKDGEAEETIEVSEDVEMGIDTLGEEIGDMPPTEKLTFYKEGASWFERRSEKRSGLLTDSKNIDQAIYFMERAKSPEAISALLHAYEFKGSYTTTLKSEKTAIYQKAIVLGEAELKKRPNDVALRYYYVANLARWGQTVGVVKSSKDGLVDEIRSNAEQILELDSRFAEGGAHRILGALHLKVPKIPFILRWPSKETALELLQSAYLSFPEHPGNVMLYAEALHENKEEEKAVALLEELVTRRPRTQHLLEDLSSLEQAKELYAGLK